MSDIRSVLDEFSAGINSIFVENNANSGIDTFTSEENIAAVINGGPIEEPCVCGACVMCNNATAGSAPVHILKDGKKVELSGLAELNKKDILMDMPFTGCETSEDKACGVKAEDIEGGEWQDVDETRNQGEDEETLKSQSSYMVCKKEWGIIFFVDDGQQVKSFADELSTFMDNLQEQFGFDRRTVGILGEIYRKIQEKYADKPQKYRDWVFTRSLSQMGGYDNKTVEKGPISYETHAWRRGAGWVYKYGVKNEEEFFCDKLGIDKEDYKYMRQMVRLQHLITSNYNNEYAYDSVSEMKKMIIASSKLGKK